MRSWLDTLTVGLGLCGLLALAAEAHGWGDLKKQHAQSTKITTPTRAFLKRQCTAVKRTLANVPGIGKAVRTHRANTLLNKQASPAPDLATTDGNPGKTAPAIAGTPIPPITPPITASPFQPSK